MLESVRITIIVSIIILVTILYHFWTGNYYRNNKFKILLTLITTFTSIMFSSAVIVQVLNYNNQKANEEIDRYNSLSKVFLDDILDIFMKHPEMNYYYNELVGLQTIDNNTKRNYVLENQISMLIFSKLAKFAIFAQETHDKDISKKIENWMGHVADTFMKSPTLKYYWINEYKPKLSGPASRTYMEKHFNL
jgi:hypothetical protein